MKLILLIIKIVITFLETNKLIHFIICTTSSILLYAAVQCPALTNPPNGMVQPSRPAMYLDVAVYRCNNEYGVVGNDTRVCLANGRWSGEAPVCECKWFHVSDTQPSEMRTLL